MIYRLNQTNERSRSVYRDLLALPESGMGFQFVRATEERRERFFLVLETTLIAELDPQVLVASSTGHAEGIPWPWSRIQWNTLAKFDPAYTPQWERKLDDLSLIYQRLPESVVTGSNVLAANQNWPLTQCQSTNQSRIYIRYSAFPSCPRICPNGAFSTGTYATSYEDSKMVPSGFAAVGRYALPNPLPNRYMFAIATTSAPTYAGTVTPNFGQAGGGVEVVFGGGATPNPNHAHEILEY